MGSIDSFIRILDFVLQGALALLVVWYALSGFQRFKDWKKHAGTKLTSPAPTLNSFIAGAKESKSGVIVISTIFLAVVVSGTYALGVIVNAVAYDLLQPHHVELIQSVQENGGNEFPDTFGSKLLISPLSRLFQSTRKEDRIARTRSLCQEIAWGNEKHEVKEAELDPIVKQLRIYRGASLCSFAFALLGLIKLIFRLLHVFFRRFKPTLRRPLTWWTPILYGSIGFIIYIGSIRGWADSEAEYHMLVRFGAQTSSPTSGPTQRVNILSATIQSTDSSSSKYTLCGQIR